MRRIPKVFIGSSSEAKRLAQAFFDIIQEKFTPVPWWDTDDFQTSYSTLENLLQILNKYDAGIFIFRPDDFASIRGEEERIVRDNVLFEYGMFLGRLGRDAAFAFMANEGSSVRTPTDLAGITIPRFTVSDDNDELRASVRRSLRDVMERIKRRPVFENDPVTGHGNQEGGSIYCMTVGKDYLQEKQEIIKNDYFIVVARKYDKLTNCVSDTRIVLSNPREVPEKLPPDFALCVELKDLRPSLKDGDFVEGALIILPGDFDYNVAKDKCNSINEILLASGGELVSTRKHEWTSKS